MEPNERVYPVLAVNPKVANWLEAMALVTVVFVKLMPPQPRAAPDVFVPTPLPRINQTGVRFVA